MSPTLVLLFAVAVHATQFEITSSTCKSTETLVMSTCTEDSTCAANKFLPAAVGETTDAPISLDATRVFGENSLYLVVKHAAVGTRTVTNIDLSSNSACNYPGPNWVKTVDNTVMPCQDVYTATIPWTTAYSQGANQTTAACGLVRTDTGDTITYDGIGLVSYVETLPDIDGTAVPPRTAAQAFRFQIDMPQNIGSITATVNTYDDPRLERAVVNQQFNPVSGVASFSLLVSTAAPLRTTGVNTVTGPTNIQIATISANQDGCQNQTGLLPCRQIYAFTFTPNMTAGACFLNGTYTFTFNIACQTGVATDDCPLGAGQTTLQIGASVSSENLCVEVVKAITVESKLTSHSSFDGNAATFVFGAARDTFFQAQTVFYRLNLTSVDKFPIATSKFSSITITDKAMTLKTIYADGQTPDSAWSFNKLDKDSNANTNTHLLEFEYKPDSTLFGDVDRLMPVASTVTVAVEVNFFNGAARKREVYEIDIASSTSKRVQSRGIVAIVANSDANAVATVDSNKQSVTQAPMMQQSNIDSSTTATFALASDASNMRLASSLLLVATIFGAITS